MATLLLLTACGGETPLDPVAPGGGAAPMPGAPPIGLPGGGLGGVPGMQPGVPGAGGSAAQVLQALAQTWGAVNSLSARYELRETKGSEVETATVTFYFKKPGRYRYEVGQHSSSIKNGSTSVFDTRSRQITSRLGGVGGLVPLKGTLTDARSKSLRGWTLDQTDYATQVEQLLAPGAAVAYAPGPGGVPMLQLTRPARMAGTVEAMTVTLDPQRLLPTQIDMTSQGQVVYRKRFSALQVNPAIAADKLNL
jgi:outer membrane lipoprotein-sorting protein